MKLYLVALSLCAISIAAKAEPCRNEEECAAWDQAVELGDRCNDGEDAACKASESAVDQANGLTKAMDAAYGPMEGEDDEQ